MHTGLPNTLSAGYNCSRDSLFSLLQPCIHEACFNDHFRGTDFLDDALGSGGAPFAEISVISVYDHICTSGELRRSLLLD